MVVKEYEKRIVAYLDILGFKSIVEDSVNNKMIFNNVYEVLNNVLFAYKEISDRMIKSNVYKRSISTMSDCIIISMSINGEKERVDDLIADLLDMQQILLSKMFLLRGAITIGDIIHNNNVVFGPAVNRAVQLEKKALYPRIIIDPNILQEQVSKRCLFELSISKKYIVKNDDYYIVNYKLDDGIFGNRYNMDLLKKNIDIQLNKCESIRCKYIWLKNYLFDKC